mgnify:CR=1 FL=1
MESNLILYTNDSGDVSIQVRYEDGTFWLTQKRMAELFNVSVSTINEHLKSIFNTGELSEEATIRKFRIVQNEGTRHKSWLFAPKFAFCSSPFRSVCTLCTMEKVIKWIKIITKHDIFLPVSLLFHIFIAEIKLYPYDRKRQQQRYQVTTAE